MATDPSNLPSTPRAEYTAYRPQVELVRRLLGGTPMMHAFYQVYIEKWKAETPESYAKRAKASKVYGMLSRSLSASIGMLFAKPPERSPDWPARIDADWESIDGRGTHGDVFAKRYTRDGLADGVAVILVDHTPPPKGVEVSAANEAEYNLRVIWSRYARLDIPSWDEDTINNRRVPTRVNLRESRAVRTGAFGVTTKTVYRVLHLGTPSIRALATLEDGGALALRTSGQAVAWWEVLEEVKEPNGAVSVIVLEAGVFRIASGPTAGEFWDEIPIAIGYAGDTDALLVAQIPLLDLAYCNLEHWRIASNLNHYSDLCAFPQRVLKGNLAADENGVRPGYGFGPGVLTHLEGDAEVSWDELKGTSLDKLRDGLHETKDEGGELGASFLSKKTRGVEAAEAKRIDSVAENATIQTVGIGTGDALNEALRLHAKWYGIPKEQAPTLTLNSDFEMATMDPGLLTALVTACKEVGLPIEILLDQMKSRGLIGKDVDLDELAAEMMANAAAAEAEAERQREMQLETLQARGQPAAGKPKGEVPPALAAE